MNRLNDLELEQALELCVRREREAIIEVLRHLREFEKRRLFLARGFPSLFAYCTGRLGYSEPEAQLRIQAMRLMRTVPEAGERIERGTLSLSVAAQIQGAVRREKLAKQESLELVRELTGMSKREAERKLAAHFPETPRREAARSISEDRVEIRFTITREEAALLEKLLNREAHKNFERSYQKLFLSLARKEIQKLERIPAQDAAPQRPEKVQIPRSRHIPASIRRIVWDRDQGYCQYVDPLTGRICGAQHGLQLDHIAPFAQGGGHNPENLRLLCGAHNRWRA